MPPYPQSLVVRRVLVAVSAYEHREFAVDPAFADLPGVELHLHLCDAPGTDAAAWALLLATFQPEILVVAWAAPALPSGYLDDPGCPLRYISFLTGSVRRLVPRAFLERGGLVTNWGDCAAPMVAEHGLLLLLAALRRLPAWRPYHDRVADRRPTLPLPIATGTLRGRTVSLHGFGRIARQLILLLAPFDVRLRAFSEGVPADFMRAHGAEPVASLSALFAGADTLVEVEALTPVVFGKVDAARSNGE